MLRDIQVLFASVPPNSKVLDYQNAIIAENVLLKPTEAARDESFRRLRQLYSLDHGIILFHTLRLLWDQANEAQPLLALLCAIARDPLLRATADFVTTLPDGATLTSPAFAKVIEERFPGRLRGTTLASGSRNIASSWTQSGHFSGSTEKMRNVVKPHPIAIAYALFLAYLCGYRGNSMFDSTWLRLLDTPLHILQEKAQQASQQGWLEYRHTGAITEITFRHFLKDKK